MRNEERSQLATAGQAMLEVGSFLAGIPIAVVLLLIGSVFGVVGALIASGGLVIGAVLLAQRNLLALAGGLVAGLLGVIVLLWLLESARPSF